jgi:hypothetical protein
MRKAHLMADRRSSVPQSAQIGLTGALRVRSVTVCSVRERLASCYFASSLALSNSTSPFPCWFRDRVPTSLITIWLRPAVVAGVAQGETKHLLTSVLAASSGHTAGRRSAAVTPAVMMRHHATGNPPAFSGCCVVADPLQSALEPAVSQTPAPASPERTKRPNSRPRNKKE